MLKLSDLRSKLLVM